MRFDVQRTSHGFFPYETILNLELFCKIYPAKRERKNHFRSFGIEGGCSGIEIYSSNVCVLFRIPQYFHIDSRTGALSTQQSLNREHIALFEFLVLSRDQGDPTRSSVTKVKVFVLDVNDQRPTFEQDTYEITLAESAPPSFIFQIKVIN